MVHLGQRYYSNKLGVKGGGGGGDNQQTLPILVSANLHSPNTFYLFKIRIDWNRKTLIIK